MLLRLAAFAVLLLSFALIACDADDPAPVEGDATPTDPDREPGAFEAMLAFVPANPALRDGHPSGIEMGDVARLRELTGEGPWDPDAETEAEYLQRLGGAAQAQDVPFAMFGFLGLRPGSEVLTISEHTRASLGFGIADSEQWMRASISPPREYGLTRGSFDPGEAARLLDACAECPPPEEVPHQGVTYWRWGEDFRQSLMERLTPPAFDDLGRGGRIAVLEHAVLRSTWDEGIEAMLDARAGEGSLADHEGFRLAAEHLDRLGTTTAFLSDRTQSTDRAEEMRDAVAGNPQLEDAAELWTPGADEAVLEPYEVLALGRGADNDGPYAVAVLVHETDELAQANVPLVERRLTEQDPSLEQLTGPPPESVEARAEGRVVIVIMRPGGPGPMSLGIVPFFLHRP